MQEKAELRRQLHKVEAERDALRDELLALAVKRAKWFSPKGRRLTAALARSEGERDDLLAEVEDLRCRVALATVALAP